MRQLKYKVQLLYGECKIIMFTCNFHIYLYLVTYLDLCGHETQLYIYVDMQLNYVDMQLNCVDNKVISVDIRSSLSCRFRRKSRYLLQIAYNYIYLSS